MSPVQTSGDFRGGGGGWGRGVDDFPDLFATIPDDRGCLRFPVFISRESLGRLGNSGIPNRLGFSRHMKTRLKVTKTLGGGGGV